jgi:nucleoside-diphosphate-sugar epimerase
MGAAYARNMLVPDSELFQANVRSTYNVIEAACKLGVKKILIASSETTYGVVSKLSLLLASSFSALICELPLLFSRTYPIWP